MDAIRTSDSCRRIRRAAPGRCRSGAASSASGRGPRSMAGRSGRSSCAYIRRKVFGYTVHIPLDPGHGPARAARQCRQLCEARHRQEAARADDRPRPALLGRRRCGATSGGSSPPISRRRRSTRSSRSSPRAARRRWRGWHGGAARHGGRRRPRRRCGSSPTALFAGDPRLITEAAMDHITAALEGVSEARLQALLGLPLMPWSLRGPAGAARPASILRETLAEVVGDRLPDGGADDFLGRLIRALDGEVRARGGAGARGRQCRDLLSRRPRDHRQCDHLDAVPAVRAARAAGRGRGRGAGRAGRGRGGCRPARAPALLRRILEESMRLYPPVPRFDRAGGRRPTGSATHEVGAGRHRLDLALAASTATARCGTIPTPSIPTASRPRPRPSATASSISRSAAARACASARASPRPRR